MTFLAPLFLAGLAALSVPIIVHLTNRPRSEAYAFPSLMFLGRVPFRSVQRQRIRHWWLLALRLAVIVLVAAAFARPLLERAGAGGTIGSGREVVILLDDSYSMRYGDRWQAALAAARRVVDGLGADDKATIVRFGDRAVSLGEPTGDRAALLAALAGAVPGFGATRYAAGLQVARDVLEHSQLPRRHLVMISDFQRAGWRPDEGVRLPAGTRVEPVNLSEPKSANVAVTGILVERAMRGQREEATLSARVANLGPAAVRGLRVGLSVDGRTVQTVPVEVDAEGSTAAVFAPLALSDRAQRVIARAGTDALPVDNEQYAVLAPGDVVPVLLVAPGGVGRGGGFVQRALQLGNDPRFEITTRASEIVRPADVAAGGLVVLADAAPGSAALVRALAEFVRRGGGVLALLGGRGAIGGGSAEWRALLGGTPGGVVDAPGTTGLGVAGLSYDHPVFESFRAPRSGDFGVVRVYRYRAFVPDSGTAVLARYDDGGAALVERRLGGGRVMVWTSGMDNVWSDLPVQPVFLPLVHQLARHLASYTERPTSYTVGQVLDLDNARRVVGGAADVSVESPSGRRVALGAAADPAVPMDEAGFYSLRALGGDVAPRSLAANVDPAEADLTPLDIDAFLASIAPGEQAASGAGRTAATASPAERERRQGFWWYLVIGAAVLALAETLLSNRLPAIGRAGGSA